MMGWGRSDGDGLSGVRLEKGIRHHDPILMAKGEIEQSALGKGKVGRAAHSCNEWNEMELF